MASQPSDFAADISHRMRVPEKIIVTGDLSPSASSSFASQDVARDRQIGDSSMMMNSSFQSVIAERPIMSVPEHIRLDKNMTPTRSPRTSSRAEHRDDPFEVHSRSSLAAKDGKATIASSREDKETLTSSRQASRITVYIPEETEGNVSADEDEEDEEDENLTSLDDSVNDDINDDDIVVERRVESRSVRRIASLEREMAFLRRRVERLERGMTLGNSPVLATLFVFWIVTPIVCQLLYRN